jgi:ribonucleotide monophosphatase NagD (HAD superfamily)
VGCPTALVLSGVSKKKEAEKWNPKIDVIVKDLAELVK